MSRNGSGRNGAGREAAPGVEPWERQPGEGDERWQAFTVYRDQPQNGVDRSLREVAHTLNNCASLIGHWSAEDNWPRRVASYDNWVDQTKRAALGRELEATVRGEAQHLAGARALIGQSVTAVLRHIAAENEQGRDPFADWDLREKMRAAATLVKALPAVVQAERLVAGLSSVNVGGHDGGAVKHAATVRAESMSRAEAEAYLLGREDAAHREAKWSE